MHYIYKIFLERYWINSLRVHFFQILLIIIQIECNHPPPPPQKKKKTKKKQEIRMRNNTPASAPEGLTPRGAGGVGVCGGGGGGGGGGGWGGGGCVC